MQPSTHHLETALAATGLQILGHFQGDDGEIILPSREKQPKAVALVGNAGSSIWPAFTEARAQEPELTLDRWTRRTIDALADEVGIEAVYPFDGPPFHPFQQWARRTGCLFASPIGLTIHPVFGLWHAFRAALLFEAPLGTPMPEAENPCECCTARPCLSTCPVQAFSEQEYRFETCLDHVAGGQGSCHDHGCKARKACPIGRDHHYQPAHAAFHMEQLLKAHRRF